MAINETNRAEAVELLARMRELLTAKLLGDLVEYGEVEFLAALEQAMADAAKWRETDGRGHVSVFQQIRFELESGR